MRTCLRTYFPLSWGVSSPSLSLSPPLYLLSFLGIAMNFPLLAVTLFLQLVWNVPLTRLE